MSECSRLDQHPAHSGRTRGTDWPEELARGFLMKTWRKFVFGGLFAVGCCSILAVFAWPACSCQPPEYHELEVANLPPGILTGVAKTSPGFRVGRAWAYGYGIEFSRGRIQGYKLRGRSPGGWWETDLKIPASSLPGVGDPTELEPIP